MTCTALVLAAMMSLQPWYQDQGEPEEQRRDLYKPVAVAICAVAKSSVERAFLTAQGYTECRFARYVLENRCMEGPPGARCDEGRATGPWQVQGWCKDAWHGTQQERLRAGAKCALRAFRLGARRCKSHEGGFAYQLGRAQCRAEWARKRVVLMNRLWSKMR